ncbi:Transcriptional regulator, AraC family [hydrothermal vent metagenome]|uniref:Transcriptional regulator, AraC family n=1 Tax=hydrothermal vent metagenome TaxID=652676 RepID=A0A3B0Y025_9ZZZZ
MAQKNENEVHTTIVSVASVLGNLLDHYGLDKYAIARQVGIDIDIAYKPNDRVSTAMLQKVWQIAVQKTSDPCIGLIYAELLQPASLCGLGLSWITSDTLKDSISRLIRFQRSISTAFDLSLNELDDSYQIIIRSHLKKPAGVTFDASIATIFRMCKITYGPELKAERVTISHPAPEPQECADKFNEFFNVQVEFNAKETQVLFAKQAFENKLTSSNPDLARMNDKVVIQYLDSFDKNNVSAQVRAKIIEQLCNGIPQQDLIASALNLSLRSLQRKLNEESTSYKEILDDTRLQLSRQYLKGSDRPIIEIGFLLGFSEPGNFARAFRRWTGESPHEYREAN